MGHPIFRPSLVGSFGGHGLVKLIAIVIGVGLLSTAIPPSRRSLMRRLYVDLALFARDPAGHVRLVGAVMLASPGVFELIGPGLGVGRPGLRRSREWCFRRAVPGSGGCESLPFPQIPVSAV